jgi:hypothetical protein
MPTTSSAMVAMTAIMKVIWVQRIKVLNANAAFEIYVEMLTGLPFCLAAFWSWVVSVAPWAQLKAGLEQFVFPLVVEQ